MSTIKVEEVDGIYSGETFSRDVTLSINGVPQDLVNYTISFSVYKSSISSTTSDGSPPIIDNNIANAGVVLIPADVTATMAGWYIMKITLDLAGFRTIRKVKFTVES